MANRMAAQIWVGGQLSANQVEELCGAIDTEGVSLEWGEGPFRPKTPRNLLRASVEYGDGRALRLCDDPNLAMVTTARSSNTDRRPIPFPCRSMRTAIPRWTWMRCVAWTRP